MHNINNLHLESKIRSVVISCWLIFTTCIKSRNEWSCDLHLHVWLADRRTVIYTRRPDLFSGMWKLIRLERLTILDKANTTQLNCFLTDARSLQKGEIEFMDEVPRVCPLAPLKRRPNANRPPPSIDRRKGAWTSCHGQTFRKRRLRLVCGGTAGKFG